MANTKRANGRNPSDIVLQAKEALPKLQGLLFPIETETDYQEAMAVLNALLDESKGNESHPLAIFVEAVGDMIADYEKRHIPEPQGSPVAVLKLLMQDHALTQTDMKELGSQGVVSEILNGKRKLNLRQVKLISQRFNISPAVLID
jgi:HTH-type transcriptional regulator/antitoxin HigA